MPGAVTHLKASYMFKIKVGNISNEPLFYLGAVCPDSVNINGHAPKAIRWPAHLRDSDLTVWEDNARRFYNENKEKYDSSLLLGYTIHIITDIVWDREFDMPLFAAMHKNGVPKEELKESRWHEIDGYELKQKDEPWLKYVCECLKKAEPMNIGTLSSDGIGLWRDKILQKEYDRSVVSNYINDELMDTFFDSVLQNMLKIIRNN